MKCVEGRLAEYRRKESATSANSKVIIRFLLSVAGFIWFRVFMNFFIIKLFVYSEWKLSKVSCSLCQFLLINGIRSSKPFLCTVEKII